MAHAATLYCRQCAQPVRKDDVASITAALHNRTAGLNDPRLLVTFPVHVPAGFSEQEALDQLQAQGYTRIHAREVLPPEPAAEGQWQGRCHTRRTGGGSFPGSGCRHENHPRYAG